MSRSSKAALRSSGNCQGNQAVIKDLRSFLKNVLKSFFRRPADRVWLSYFLPRLLTNFHCPICGLYCSSQCYWHWDWTRNLAPCKVGLERTLIVGYRFLFLHIFWVYEMAKFMPYSSVFIELMMPAIYGRKCKRAKNLERAY